VVSGIELVLKRGWWMASGRFVYQLIFLLGENQFPHTLLAWRQGTMYFHYGTKTQPLQQWQILQ
jgi:hypothetical protein